jgi:hypothetical protein
MRVTEHPRSLDLAGLHEVTDMATCRMAVSSLRAGPDEGRLRRPPGPEGSRPGRRTMDQGVDELLPRQVCVLHRPSQEAFLAAPCGGCSPSFEQSVGEEDHIVVRGKRGAPSASGPRIPETSPARFQLPARPNGLPRTFSGETLGARIIGLHPHASTLFASMWSWTPAPQASGLSHRRRASDNSCRCIRHWRRTPSSIHDIAAPARNNRQERYWICDMRGVGTASGEGIHAVPRAGHPRMTARVPL